MVGQAGAHNIGIPDFELSPRHCQPTAAASSNNQQHQIFSRNNLINVFVGKYFDDFSLILFYVFSKGWIYQV